MKKTYLVGLTLLLTASLLGACNSNDNKPDFDFTTEEIGGFSKREIGDSKDVLTVFGSRFSANVVTINETDYLRVVYPVKGEFKTLEYSTLIASYSETAIKTEVKEVYKAVKRNKVLSYATETTGTKDKANSGDWYWACLDIAFNSKKDYKDAEIKIVLTGEDNHTNRFATEEYTCTYNNVKNRLSYYWGDGSEEEEWSPALPMSLDGGWQLQYEGFCANAQVDAGWGYISVDTDNGWEDFSLIGVAQDGSYTFECYDEGKISVSGSDYNLTLNISEGCENVKEMFAPIGSIVTFER